jgi:tetratricopeptide (TPR) repeat protein
VLVERGRAEVELGRLNEAAVTLETGLWDALACGNDRAAFTAVIAHMHLSGVTMADEAAGREDIVRSEALLKRAGGSDVQRLQLLEASGATLGRHGEYREARVRLDEALALAERLHGREHVSYAAVLGTAGAVALWGDDLDQAERIFGEQAELDRKLYDPKHTIVANVLNNLAIVMARKGDHAAAQARFREVYEVRRSALGEQHVEVADALMNLSGAVMEGGDPGAALLDFDRGRAIYAKALGEDAAPTINADVMRSMALTRLARPDEAEPILRSVLARQRKRLGERHPDLGPILSTLGRLLVRPNDVAEAVALLGEAIEIRRNKLTSSGVPLDRDTVLTELEEARARAQRVLRGEEPEREPTGAEPGGAESE